MIIVRLGALIAVGDVPLTALLAWNPLTFIVESYRHLLLGHSTASTLEYGIPSVIITFIIFLFGLVLYNKTQRSYVDYV